MRLAIIDLGTNSVRFDVHQLGPGSQVRRLHREKLMVRLGQGVFIDGKLDPQAIRRTLQAFASFKHTAQVLHTNKIVAFGTSALREAVDSKRFLASVKAKTGIDLRVISGEEEARLIALGVLAHETADRKKIALIDIGGGSTEVSIIRNRQLLHSESFPLGTARLQQVFLKSSPPKNSDAIPHLRRYIKSVVLPRFIADEWPKAAEVYASSGTARALARIIRNNFHAKSFEGNQLTKLVKTMSKMTTAQLLALPQMEEKRADMILAGAVLLDEILQALKTKQVLLTEYSLRDGILEEQLQLLRSTQSSPIAFHLPDLLASAQRFGMNQVHLEAVAKLSELLFDRLRRIHRLAPKWKMYLTAAAILHDVGEAITPTHHEQHSYYIVKNADFPSMDPWENEFIAQLCLHHRGAGAIDTDNVKLGGSAKVSAQRKDAFLKILSFLRIADALDRGHQGTVRIRKISIRGKNVHLSVSGQGPIDLELLRIEQKKDLFEALFKKKLITQLVR